MSTQKQLTDKQKAFCEQYLVDHNARKAAMRAGYSRSTASKGALIKIPQIREYINREYAALNAKLDVSKEMIVQEMAKIAFQDIREFYNADGSIKNPNELSAKARASLSSMRIEDVYSAGKKEVVGKKIRIKMHNKVGALEKLARQLGVDKTIYRSYDDLSY